MRIGITGSRRRKDKATVIDFINGLPADSIVISGGCRGVDTWAIEAAEARGLETKTYLPNLDGTTSRGDVVNRYYARNRQIAEACEALAAFPAPDRKGGTEHTIREARRLGRPVELILAR